MEFIYKTYSENVSLPFLANALTPPTPIPTPAFNDTYSTTLTQTTFGMPDLGIVSGIQDFMDFMKEWRAEGFFHAIYGKSFSAVMGDFFKELGYDIGMFVLNSGDVIFLLPAILAMLATFFVGKNRFTKWIIPLWFAYAVTRIFYFMGLQ